MQVKTIYTCDRCGKEFEWTEKFFRVYKPKKYFMRTFKPCTFYQDGYDLCDNCKKSFESWLDNPKLDVHYETKDLSGEARNILDGMLEHLGSDDEDNG